MSGTDSRTEVVRAMMQAYLDQDLVTAERLLDDRLTFTSPQDEHIDKAAFLQRCFPTADRTVSQEVLQCVDGEGDQVFLLYEYVLKTGERHRNVEVQTVRDGRIQEIQVFFGGRY
jgi:ketosteroid isomerase-like protein